MKLHPLKLREFGGTVDVDLGILYGILRIPFNAGTFFFQCVLLFISPWVHWKTKAPIMGVGNPVKYKVGETLVCYLSYWISYEVPWGSIIHNLSSYLV